MIIRENDSDTTPDDLADLRDAVLRRQKNRSDEDSRWRNSYEHSDHDSADDTLKLSRILAIAALAIIGIAVVYPASFTVLFAGWGILLLYCVHSIFQENRKRYVLDESIVGNHFPLPKSTTLWGIAIPLSMAALLYLVLPNNNVNPESIVRWLFLSILSTLCSTVVAHSLSKVINRPKLLGFLNGLTFGTALAGFILFGLLVPIIGRISDLSVLVPIIGLSLVYSGGLAKKLLLHSDRSVAPAVFGMACIGTLLTFAVGLAPELRGLAIAFGEKLAISSDAKANDLGYKILKDLNAAPELANASDRTYRRPISLAESFLPISTEDGEKMYFFVAGKAHEQPGTTISNYENVRQADPNAKVAGLSLVESNITGHVDANSLTSVTYWTMVFGNNTNNPQEAQARISLPPNSAVSRVTLWVNGKAQEAAFNSTARVTQAYQWIAERKRDPLLITEPSRGIINLQAYPVPQFGEMKVRIGITSALDAESRRDFSFVAPKILSSNFGLSDAKTFVKLESNAPIDSNAEVIQTENNNGRFTYTGTIQPGSVHNYQFVAHRNSDFTGYSARATHSAEDMIISERLIKSSSHVGRLAIVIDGSSAVSGKKDQIKQALEHVPTEIPSQVFLADHRSDFESLSVKDAIARLNNVEYGGGVDDTNALLAAKKFVGRAPHAAIVWIHGPQLLVLPSDQDSLHQLMISGEHRLNVYDFQLDEQPNAIKNQLVSWSRTASPDFHTIEQGGSVSEDLTSFFNSALAHGASFTVLREKVPNPHSNKTSNDFPVASRLSTIWAADEARRCAELGQTETAVTLGTVYRVVTPATGAVVMELQSDYEHESLTRNFYSVISAKTRATSGDSDSAAIDKVAVSDAFVNPYDTSEKVGFSNLRRDSAFQSFPSAQVAASPRRATGATRFSTPSSLVPPPPAVTLSTAPSVVQFAAPSAVPFPQSDSADGASFAPSLQGATSGTIGPQGSDATVITGVNTAGTVRVNNIAPLETALKLLFSALQGGGIISGAIFLFQGFFMQKTRLGASKKLVIGSVLLLLGIAASNLYPMLFVRDIDMFS